MKSLFRKQQGHLPNLIIIGAMKAGTTSLHHYLNLHPEIFMSRKKELNFFIEKEHGTRGLSWYQSNFVGQARVFGESSPNYTNHPFWKGVPARMAQTIPTAKIIYLVRHPIKRMVSEYLHQVAAGIEHRSLVQAFKAISPYPYVQRSRYFFQLEQYLSYFSAEQILVVTSEELQRFPGQTMARIFQFLDVDARFTFTFSLRNIGEIWKFGPTIANPNFNFDAKLHQSAYKKSYPIRGAYYLSKLTRGKLLKPQARPRVPQSLHDHLLDYLSEDIEQLTAFTGRTFHEWNLDKVHREI